MLLILPKRPQPGRSQTWELLASWQLCLLTLASSCPFSPALISTPGALDAASLFMLIASGLPPDVVGYPFLLWQAACCQSSSPCLYGASWWDAPVWTPLFPLDSVLGNDSRSRHRVGHLTSSVLPRLLLYPYLKWSLNFSRRKCTQYCPSSAPISVSSVQGDKECLGRPQEPECKFPCPPCVARLWGGLPPVHILSPWTPVLKLSLPHVIHFIICAQRNSQNLFSSVIW